MLFAFQILCTLILTAIFLYVVIKIIDDIYPDAAIVLGYIFACLIIVIVPDAFIIGLVEIWRW